MLTGTHHQWPSTRQALPIAFGRMTSSHLPSVATSVEVEQLAARDQLLVLAARIELRRFGRIAAEHALHDGRASRLAKRDGAIDPFVALAVIVERLGELATPRPTRPSRSTSG